MEQCKIKKQKRGAKCSFFIGRDIKRIKKKVYHTELVKQFFRMFASNKPRRGANNSLESNSSQ